MVGGPDRGGSDPRAVQADAGWPWPEVEKALRSAAATPQCTVHVIGRPGGLLRLNHGQVVDIWTVGSPLAVPSPDRRPKGEAAVRTSSLPKGTAVADALFAMATGQIRGLREEPGQPSALLGVDLDHVLRETHRRLAVLAGRTVTQPPLHPEAQPRAADAQSTASQSQLISTAEQKVLGLADGVNTVRDIAFLLGRGLYAVTLDVARLEDVGLLELVPETSTTAEPERVRRYAAAAATPPSRSSGGVLALFARRWPRADPPSSAAAGEPGDRLPRRTPGGRTTERHSGTRLSEGSCRTEQ